MTEQILRRKQLEHRIGVAGSTIYRWMAQRRFPRPLRLGPGAVGWRSEVVEQWLADHNSAEGLTKRY